MKRETAARRISYFWRISNSKESGIYDDYLKVKAEGDFYHRFLKIKSLTPGNLREDKNDVLIKEAINYCVTAGNRHALRMIAYALFSDNKSFLIVKRETQPIIFLLLCAFSHEQTPIKNIAFVLWDLYITGKNILIDAEPRFQKELEKGRYWHDKDEDGDKKLQPDDVVYISHGGGLFFILDFLTKRKQGYTLEGSKGLGLQVSPAVNTTWENYHRAGGYAVASGGNKSFFDLPAKLEAKIACLYLLRANLGYEAGLRPEYIDKLKDISIEEVSFPPGSVHARWPGVSCFNPDFIQDRYGSKYPEQTQSLTKVIQRLAAENRLDITEREYTGHEASNPAKFKLKI